MPSLATLAAFLLAAFVILVVPGPSVLFAVSRTLVLGRRGGLITIVGNSTGGLLQVTLVALGVGELVERSIVVFTVLKLAGALYLAYLGVQAIRHRRSLAEAFVATGVAQPSRVVYRQGLLVGATNPKSIVFFVAILPQFADRSAGHLPLQLFILGCMFVLLGVLTDTVWTICAGAARSWFAGSPRRLSRIGGVGGAAMIGVGATVALTGRID